jgi:hypothetical protein
VVPLGWQGPAQEDTTCANTYFFGQLLCHVKEPAKTLPVLLYSSPCIHVVASCKKESSQQCALLPAVCLADVTRRASQLLLAHRGLLTAPQLARLAAKMSEVGMTQEITGLVDSSVASGSHQGQAVGFVAAALTGEGWSEQSCMVGWEAWDSVLGKMGWWWWCARLWKAVLRLALLRSTVTCASNGLVGR